MAAPRASNGAEGPVKVVDAAGGASVGLTFNLSEPDKKIVVGETGEQFPAQPVADLMRRRFGRAVDVVAVLHLSKGIEVSAGAGRSRRRSRPRPRRAPQP